MANIRCPMCGKSASDELDICPFCQARLKPMKISSPDEDNSIQPEDKPVRKDTTELESIESSGSSPREVESTRSEEAPFKKNSSESEFTIPGGLRKLRRQTNDKTPVDELVESVEPSDEIQKIPEISETIETIATELPENLVEEEEVTDWLSGLEQTAQEEDETPGWLANIKNIPQKEQLIADTTDDGVSQEEGNWLDSLRGDSPDQIFEPEQELAETQPEEPVFEEGVPDWMKKLQAEVDAQSAASEPKEDYRTEHENEDSPDWLNRLQTETQSNAASNESTASETDESPDWLEKMNVEIPEPSDEVSASDSETPEWLRNLQLETLAFSEDVRSTESEPQFVVEENQISGSETPAPLEDIETETRTFSEEDLSSGSETPDWLKEISAETLDPVDESVLPPIEMPERLTDRQNDSQVFSEDIEFSETETPEWLKSLGSELQDVTEPDRVLAATGEFADIQSDLPHSESEKLDELTSVDSESVPLTSLNLKSDFNQQEAGDQIQPDVEDQQPGSELMPDWLKNIDKTEPISSGNSALILDEQYREEEPEALLSVEMPDWLNKLKTDGEGSQSNEDLLGIEAADDEIKPSELPSWVQAMRPVETMVTGGSVSDKIEQITEKIGPLAGLHGVLPATPGLGKLRKPLNYSIKLRVTDDQSLQADQLEKMIDFEAQAKSITLVNKKMPQRILRWVVTILVFLAVALPVISGNQDTSSPSIYPPELVAAREILFNLPQASPVLLVFDYEPAYSGELEVTAAPMMDNLLFSGARLAILSTSPTGPILAEHFLKTTQSQYDLLSGQQYTNLGYLAGGASGVLSFALNPSQTIPIALDGSLPWETPLLQDIHTLSDFKAVIVLTDNSDTARIWVEQVEMILNDTPLLMAISAQAEPMIRPYFDSKQIKGLVTGLAGGKAYEQALQLSGLGQLYWNSFSSGFFIAELIIILGGLWSIVSIWRNRKSVSEEEA